MSAHITLSTIAKQLIPLTTEPLAESSTSVCKDYNHMGWVKQFQSLIELEKNIDPEIFNGENKKKISQVFDKFIVSMVKLGFDVNKPLYLQDYKPLHKATQNGCLMTLASLLDQGADVHGYKEGTSGNTALFVASHANQVEAATLLIKNNADVNQRNRIANHHRDPLPLHTATSPEMCSLLVSNGCSVNEVCDDVFMESALHWNAHCARPDTIFTLLKLGATDFKYPKRYSALEVARKVQAKEFTVMMDQKWNPITTRLSVELLENPELGKFLFASKKV